jgi:regulation of enolase protein 1 (concanavalin A-like superfamily)
MSPVDWLNEPRSWTIEGNTITVTSDARTDFWRKTHYGFIRDSGHFHYQPVTGDFVAEVNIKGKYNDLYDQAGLMVREDETTWLKCGVEFVEGKQFASAVITRDYSDWSVVPLADNPLSIWMRVVRHGSSIEVFYSLNGIDYTMIRTAYLTTEPTVNVGIMCASPTGNGFMTVFEHLGIREP